MTHMEGASGEGALGGCMEATSSCSCSSAVKTAEGLAGQAEDANTPLPCRGNAPQA